MANNKPQSKAVASWFNNADTLRGIKLHDGTYVGIVKNVLDPDRLGRLQAWIPTLGGQENDDSSWVTVRYASPFLGSTNTPGDTYETKDKSERFNAISQTYGFWAVPPDINNQILITFANGDPNSAFWFACVFDREGHNMIPGNPGGQGGTDFDASGIVDPTVKQIVQKLGSKANLPTSEYNRYDPNLKGSILTNKKVLHEYLAQSYINQGLDRDLIRGPGRSSAQRDMPSGVFGWSTPGRPVNDSGVNNGTPAKPGEIYGRKGGHSFVMDDGDFFGQGQNIRLRSSSGHQILMDDTEGTMYINNRDGSCWIELSSSGQLSIFSSGGLNIRTRGDFNVHSDRAVNIFGQTGINLRSNAKLLLEGKSQVGITGTDLTIFGNKSLNLLSQNGTIVVDSKGSINIQSGKNINTIAQGRTNAQVVSEIVKTPKAPPGIATYQSDDTVYQNKTWQAKPKSVETIVPVFPTHEPWSRQGFDTITRNPTDVSTGAAPQQSYASGSEPASTIISGHPTLNQPGSVPVPVLPGIVAGQGASVKVLPSQADFTKLTKPNGKTIQ